MLWGASIQLNVVGSIANCERLFKECGKRENCDKRVCCNKLDQSSNKKWRKVHYNRVWNKLFPKLFGVQDDLIMDESGTQSNENWKPKAWKTKKQEWND